MGFTQTLTRLCLSASVLKENLVFMKITGVMHDNYGLANMLQGRIDIHQKHGWMLRATMAKPGSDL